MGRAGPGCEAGRARPIRLAWCDRDGALWYHTAMDQGRRLSPSAVENARRRRLVAMRVQEIEGNPFDAADVAMFEMFEREAWPHERRRAYILARVTKLAAE
jgi:hypothetical protein